MFTALAASLLASVMAAAKPYEDVTLFVNRPDGQFAKGEKIVFSAVAEKDITEPLTMKIFEEGSLVKTMPVKITRDTSVIYECSYDRKMSVFIQVTPGGKLTNAVGAIVAPEEYRPGYDQPKDFKKYWRSQVAAMRKVKPVITRTPMALPAEDAAKYDAWALELSMHQGPSVHGYLVMPKGAAKKSLPIVIFAHSAGVNDVSKRSSLPQALSFAKMGGGAIALDMNAHGMLDGQPQSYYDELNKGALKGYSHRPLTTREDYYFRLMFLRMERALDYLCSLPEWDGKRVAVRGGSQGGAQSIALAGIDKRVSMAVVHVPAHHDVAAGVQGRRAPWPGYGKEIEENPELAASILPYFDGVNFMRNTKAAIRCEAGLVDQTCPPGAVFAAFNVCPSKDKTIVTFPYRPHTALPATMGTKYFNAHDKAIEQPRVKALNDYLK